MNSNDQNIRNAAIILAGLASIEPLSTETLENEAEHAMGLALKLRKDCPLERSAVEILSALVEGLELVFDHDWEFTEIMIRSESNHYISAMGTFLRPGVVDESHNWANRRHVLDNYRKARKILFMVD